MSSEPLHDLPSDESPTSGDRLGVDEAASEEDMKWLDSQLEAYNKDSVGFDDFTPMRLVIRDSDGEIIAGLKGLTGWQWLYVQTLWVHEDHRRTHLGQRLLEHAERLSRDRNCLGSCLSSFDFQAPAFYEKLGYRSLGKIEHYPNEHTLFFLSKIY